LPFSHSTVFGNQAPLHYDAPMKEILPCILRGASMIFIPRELFLFPVKLLEYICEHRINTLCWAASAFAVVSSLGALDEVDMSHLRLICHGSESFPRGEYDKWRAACPCAAFVNLYGPTEATGMSAYWIADRELEAGESIPIGRAFPNTEIFLIDEKGNEVTSFLYDPYEQNDSYEHLEYKYSIYTATNGYIAVLQDGKWGLIDTEGNVVLNNSIPIIYKTIENNQVEERTDLFDTVKNAVHNPIDNNDKPVINLIYVKKIGDASLFSINQESPFEEQFILALQECQTNGYIIEVNYHAIFED
jgi:acyl-CoA synthetase (AMP-forming)/AMP-acid ligase II